MSDISSELSAKEWWFRAFAAVFIIVSAAFFISHFQDAKDSDARSYDKLVNIDKTTAVFNNQLENINRQLEDHESRIKDLEKSGRGK